MMFLLAACSYLVDLDDTGALRVERAQLEVSPTELDFGTLPLGDYFAKGVTVKNTGGSPTAVELSLVDPREGFCVYWAGDGEVCGDEETSRGRAKAGGTGGAGDTARDSGAGGGVHIECPGGAVADETTFILHPGCERQAFAVFSPTSSGAYLAGIKIDTADSYSSRVPPEIDRDPREFTQHVRLEGAGEDGTAEVTLDWVPRAAAFDWHWPDGTARSIAVEVMNPGGEPVTLAAMDLSQCPGVAGVSEPAPGTVLAAGEAALIGLSFTATDPGAFGCLARELTDTGDYGDLVLTVTPPAHSDPPALSIVVPLPGESVLSTEALELQVDLADDLQPPSSLDVTVTVAGWAATSSPVDDSGRASFTIPAATLAPGPATIVVTATDLQGEHTSRSVPVRVDTIADDDADADGWGVLDGDCDDTNAAVYLNATELVDGFDNDCDGVIDDETDVADDDRDGVTEAEGDCDDDDRETHPGAPERADGDDNDCDNEVDNGTGESDDDGDGYPEAEGDCDDSDSAVSPLAVELCDGVDNDCDGFRDPAGGCVGPEDLQVAYLDLSPDACAPGETVTATLAAIPDGFESAWSTDLDGLEVLGDTVTATLVCPVVETPLMIAVSVVLLSAKGEYGAATAKLEVYPDESVFADPRVYGNAIVPATACNPSGGKSALGALGVLLLGALARRRRATPP